MDQPYSFAADWLSKFHTAPELIQALWLVAIPVTVLGITWIIMRGLRDIAVALRREGRAIHGLISIEEPLRLPSSSPVMPGLDPGIHALTHAAKERRGWPGQARP